MGHFDYFLLLLTTAGSSISSARTPWHACDHFVTIAEQKMRKNIKEYKTKRKDKDFYFQ